MGARNSADSSSPSLVVTDSNAASFIDNAVASDSTVRESFADSGVALTDTAPVSTNPHTPIPATKCESGQVPSPVVTSSVVVALTRDEFASRCAALNGIFEVQPLCGGYNSCRGMSYDSGTQTLTEHS